jgi:hypothetical protein
MLDEVHGSLHGSHCFEVDASSNVSPKVYAGQYA